MMTLKRSRMFSRATICATVLMASALAAAPVPAQQIGPAVGQQHSGDATRSLFDAVQANDLAAVQASIAAGADVAARDQWGLTPIDLAIDKSYFDVAHFLLSVRNFQRNEVDPRGSALARQPAAGFNIPAPSSVSGGSSVPKALPETARTTPGGAAGQETRSQPIERWPVDQPNPFDPNLPAPGAVLPGDGVGEAFRGQGHTAAAKRPQVQ